MFGLLAFPRVHGWRDKAVLAREFATLSQVVNQVPVFEATIPWGPPFDPDIARSDPQAARLTVEFPPGFFDRADPAPTSRSTGRRGSSPTSTTAPSPQSARSTTSSASARRCGEVLDLMSSWVSHFTTRPRHLTVLGMNDDELAANPQATATVVHDLNADPVLPFPDDSFDAAVCCVSVDYLVRPVEVFADVARVVRPGGLFVCTFSNRCFPTKAIRGWLTASDAEHGEIVAEYFRRAGGWDEPVIERRTPPGLFGDPSGRCGRPSLDSPTHEGLPTRVARRRHRRRGLGRGEGAQQGPRAAHQRRWVARAAGPRLPVTAAFRT